MHNGHILSSLLLMGLRQCYLCCYISDKLRLSHQSKERTGPAYFQIFQMHTENLKKNQHLFLRQELFPMHHCIYSWYLGEHCWCFPRGWQRKEPKEPLLFFSVSSDFLGVRFFSCFLLSNFLKSHYWLLIQR